MAKSSSHRERHAMRGVSVLDDSARGYFTSRFRAMKAQARWTNPSYRSTLSLEPGHHPAVAVQPGERPLDDPPPLAAAGSRRPSAVGGRVRFLRCGATRREPVVGQVLPERVRVVRPVGHHRHPERDRHGRRDVGQGRPGRGPSRGRSPRRSPPRSGCRSRSIDHLDLHRRRRSRSRPTHAPLVGPRRTWRPGTTRWCRASRPPPTPRRTSFQTRCHTPAAVQSRCRRQQVDPGREARAACRSTGWRCGAGTRSRRSTPCRRRTAARPSGAGAGAGAAGGPGPTGGRAAPARGAARHGGPPCRPASWSGAWRPVNPASEIAFTQSAGRRPGSPMAPARPAYGAGDEQRGGRGVSNRPPGLVL